MTKSEHNRKCYMAHRERILESRITYRQENKEQIREYFRNYRRVYKYDYRERRRAYRNSPRGRETGLRRLYRFIENHPEYDLEFLERLVKINERTISLDQVRGNSERNLYDFVAIKA